MVTGKENSSEPATRRVYAIRDHKANSFLMGAEGNIRGLTERRGKKIENDCCNHLLGIPSIMKLRGLQ